MLAIIGIGYCIVITSNEVESEFTTMHITKFDFTIWRTAGYYNAIGPRVLHSLLNNMRYIAIYVTFTPRSSSGASFLSMKRLYVCSKYADTLGRKAASVSGGMNSLYLVHSS